jgi:FAD:protein FMN transferase
MADGHGFPVHTRKGLGEDAFRFSHDGMATTFEIVVVGHEQEYARQASAAAFRLLAELEMELSRFEGGSDVWQINALPANQAVAVGDATLDCLQLAREVADETDGAFDVTAGALMERLRDEEGRSLHPSEEELAEALKSVGMDLLVVDAEQRAVGVLADGVRVDLGGVGKGCALDRMAELLADWDVETAFLSGGTSTVLAVGPADADDAWLLSVREPGADEATESICLRNRSFSGSGTAQQGMHVVDPRTGARMGSKTNAWAAADSAALSDALSTAFMVLTPEEIEAYCTAHDRVGAMLLIEKEGDQKLLRFGRWDS